MNESSHLADFEEVLPWEEPGAVRRDCEPHRAGALAFFGVFGLILCLLGVTAVLGLPVALVVWVLAHRDLKKMDAGLMDPEGRAQATRAWENGTAGTLLGIAAWGLAGLILWMTLPLLR